MRSPAIKPRPKVDDKAARLEQQLERLERKSANEKFIGSFVAIIIFLSFISVYVPGYAFFEIFLLSLILLLALAFHWEFREVVGPIRDLFYFRLKRAQKREGDSPDETE
jgi:hypothetical protein